MWSRTSREVDGENVIGSWRHAFINNGGSYYLTDLIVYADGLVDCWGLVTLDEFRDKLRTGWVATTFTEGANASAHEVASWTFTNVRSWVTADELYGEVVGEIEALNGRLDASGICLAALEVYVADQTETNRRRLELAYDNIPAHRRPYVLGDQDAKDWPLRVLVTPVGKELAGKVVTDERGARRSRTSQSVLQPADVSRAGTLGAVGGGRPRFLSPRRLAGPARHPGPSHAVPGAGPDRRHHLPDRGARLLGTSDHRPGGPRGRPRGVESLPTVLVSPASRPRATAGTPPSRQPSPNCSGPSFTARSPRAGAPRDRGGPDRIPGPTGFGGRVRIQQSPARIGRLLEVVRAEQRAWRSGTAGPGSARVDEWGVARRTGPQP